MTQPSAAVFSKATFLRGMVVSMKRVACCHQYATRNNFVSQMDRRGGRSFQATLRRPLKGPASQRNPQRLMS
jgi:hypothetical protein